MTLSRRDAALAFLVAAVFLLLGTVYFTGLYCSDDTRYMLGAMRIALGEPISTASLAERRVMFLLPAALFHAAGRDVELLVAPYLLFFAGTGCAGYLLARRFMSSGGALLAAVLSAAQPVLFLYAGAMLPDIASAFFYVLALLLTCCWVQATCAARGASPRTWLAFGTGLAMAASFTIKESGLVLLVVPLAVMVLGSSRLRARGVLSSAAALALGLVVVLALEALVFRFAAGHWYSSLLSLSTPHDMQAYTRLQGIAPWDRLATLRATLGPYTTGLFLLAGVSTLHLLRRWWRGRLTRLQGVAWLAIVLGWAWPMMAFTFGSVSLTEYLPPVIQQRYYAPAIVPAATLVAHLLVCVARFGPGARLRTGMVPAAMLAVWFLGAPWALHAERGLIYGAGAKEAFLLARGDAAERHPGIPLYDVESGWTTDLARCRALLVPGLPGGEERLAVALRSGSDRHGGFMQPAAEELEPPFLILGHGPFLDPGKPGEWGADLLRREAEGELSVRKLGRYGPPSHEVVEPWLPRTLAVRTAGAEAVHLQPDGNEHPDGRAEFVDLYLVTALETGRQEARPGVVPGQSGCNSGATVRAVAGPWRSPRAMWRPSFSSGCSSIR